METTMQLEQPQNHGSQSLTHVESIYLAGRKNYRLLFGNPVSTQRIEFKFGVITRKLHTFNPGDIFAIDLWNRNDYGTTNWSVYVLQAALPGELAVLVPQVTPAARILLAAEGPTLARQAIRLLKEIEDRTDPAQLPPARFLLTDFRLKSKPLSKARRCG